MERKSFIFYSDWLQTAIQMQDERAKEFIYALVNYALGNDYEVKDEFIKGALMVPKIQIDENKSKYLNVCEARRIAGKKGGEANMSKSKQNQANASNCLQMVASAGKTEQNNLDNDNDNDNDDGNGNHNQDDKEGSKEPKKKCASAQGGFVPDLSFVDDRLKEKIKEWLDYREKNKWGYKAQSSLTSFYKQLQKLSGNSVSEAIDIIDQSMASGWRGIFPLEKKKGGISTLQAIKATQELQREISGDFDYNPWAVVKK